MRIFGYIRVSSRGQLAGDGPERQVDAIAAFCKEFGLTSMGQFRDAHTGTAEGMNRPGFSDMIGAADAAATCRIEAIVVERMDRLARDLMVSEVLLAECRKRGIKVFSADQGQLLDMASDGGDPTRVLIRQVMGALSQWAKSELVLKLRKARERKREKFGRCEGFAPYGEKPSEAMVLKIIRDMREEGKTWENIVEFLNSSGFTTRWGKTWKVTNIIRLHKRNK